jgi:magnesium-transporting ATPase (P-type)
VLGLFGRQFLSPCIYVLLFATALSLDIRHWSDALFMAAVLLLNAVIGPGAPGVPCEPPSALRANTNGAATTNLRAASRS